MAACLQILFYSPPAKLKWRNMVSSVYEYWYRSYRRNMFLEEDSMNQIYRKIALGFAHDNQYTFSREYRLMYLESEDARLRHRECPLLA